MFLRHVLSSLIVVSLISACSNSHDSAAELSAGHGDHIGRFLDPVDVPGRVADAVAEVTRLGREEGDFFGFQRVEAYDLIESAAEPQLKKIVADVIEATRKHGDFSIAHYCAGLGFDDDNECALHLIGHNKGEVHASLFSDLRTWYDVDSTEGQRMNKAFDHIQSYVGKMVGGDDLEEITVNMSGLNVDEVTSVLINKAKGHVVIFKYDYGA